VTLAIELTESIGANNKFFRKGREEGEIDNIRPHNLAKVMGDRQAEEKWGGGQETEQQAFPEAAIQAEFGKGVPEIFPQRKSDRCQAKKDLQRSLDPFWYIKGMTTVEMAARGNAHQPCLRVIKKVEHRQNKNGI
jgi:hypothetical protein